MFNCLEASPGDLERKQKKTGGKEEEREGEEMGG